MSATRAACAEDAEALARLHALCFEDAWNAAVLSALITAPGAIALAAGESEPQAFIVVRVAADECEILTLGTHPAARRSGLANALVKDAAAAAHAKGAHAIYLEVADDNASAIALYRGLGFAETGRRRSYYRRKTGAVDALLFKAALPL